MRHNSQKDLQQSTSLQQAREFIKEYMGENLIRLDIISQGRTIFASITYCDFKPARTVRRHIEDAIPNIDIEELARDYSDERVSEAIWESKLTIYVKEPDGCLRPTTPCDMVDELLRYTDFTQEPEQKELTEEELQHIVEENQKMEQQQLNDGVFTRPSVSE